MSFFRPWEVKVNEPSAMNDFGSQLLCDPLIRSYHVQVIHKLYQLTCNAQSLQLKRYYFDTINTIQSTMTYYQHQTSNSQHIIRQHYQLQYIQLYNTVQETCSVLEQNRNNMLTTNATDSDYYSEDTSPISHRNEVSPNSEKRNRLLSKEVITKLNTWYNQHQVHPYPTSEEAMHLASQCNIASTQVKKWMANKRMRSHNTKQHQRVSRRNTVKSSVA